MHKFLCLKESARMQGRLHVYRLPPTLGQNRLRNGRLTFVTPARISPLIIAVLLLSGCHSGTSVGVCSGDRVNNTPDVQTNSNTLRYPITSEPTTLDPAT